MDPVQCIGTRSEPSRRVDGAEGCGWMERCFADEDQQVEDNMGYGLVSGGYRTREQLWEGDG